MKSVLFALFILPSLALGARVEGPKFVKLLDGGVATCTKANELGRSAYMPRTLDFFALNRDELLFGADVSFLTCAASGDGIGWAPRSPLEPIPGLDLDGRPILTKTRENEIVLFSSTMQFLGKAALTGDANQRASALFRFDQVLIPGQREALERGEPVQSRLIFFTRAIVTVVDSTGKEIQLGLRAGGAYTVLFTLVKGGQFGVEVSEVSFQ